MTKTYLKKYLNLTNQRKLSKILIRLTKLIDKKGFNLSHALNEIVLNL